MIIGFFYNVVLFLLLNFFSLYIFAFSFKYRNVNKYGFNSTIITIAILIIMAFSILLIDNLIPYPLNAAIIVWLSLVFLVQIGYFLLARFAFKERGNKSNIDQTTYDGGELKLKSEYMRKGFHTVILLVAICYFAVALWVNDFVYEIYLTDKNLYYSIWNIKNYPLNPKSTSNLQIALSWTFMFFLSALMLLLIPDMFRIYNRKYSIFSGVYKRVIRMKELYALGPQIYLTLSCAFVFLFVMLNFIPPAVAIAGMMIAAFGDAAAAIFGRKFGKHQFETFFDNGTKSYEGLVAGFLVGYISALIFVGPIVALFGALMFSLIDYLNIKIADNVLNPIFCTLIMMVPFFLFA